MSVTLAKNTKEYVRVDVTDDTGVVTDISGLSPKFDFINDSNTSIYSAATATASGMTISCLLDTTATGPSGLLPVGHYRLFVSFTVGSEIPRLGPIDVFIKDVNA
jgi:hypothetical protein